MFGSVSSFNLNDAFQNSHVLLHYQAKTSEKMKGAISQYLKQLDNDFEILEKDLQDLSIDVLENSGIQSSPINLLDVKYIIASILISKESAKDLVSCAARIEKILAEIHHDLAYINKQAQEGPVEYSEEFINKITKELSYLDKVSKFKEGESTDFIYTFQTDQERLGPELTDRTLRWLQNARLTLLKGEGTTKLAPHQLTSLMKRIGDLEDQLQKTKEGADFVKLLFSLSEIDLDEVTMAPIEGEDKGASGSFFVYDTTPGMDNADAKKMAVFKPSSGDAGAVPAVPVGKSLMRQTAAYLIDKMNGGKAGVALTLRAISSSEGVGALQVFKNNGGNVYSLSDSERFSISPHLLHLLTIHRARLYDLDGHLGNVLWQLSPEGEIEVISIDHDYCFPVFTEAEDLLDYNNRLKLMWANFPQMNVPFDNDTKDYIRSLDVKCEVEMLRELGLPPESINLFKTITWFFQEAVETSLLPGEMLDYLLSENYSGQDKYELVRFMIQTQQKLSKSFDDPMGINWDEYCHEFEISMKTFIKEKVAELEQDILRTGSFRRSRTIT